MARVSSTQNVANLQSDSQVHRHRFLVKDRANSLSVFFFCLEKHLIEARLNHKYESLVGCSQFSAGTLIIQIINTDEKALCFPVTKQNMNVAQQH